MNTYFVIFLTKDQDKCELVRKVKNELDFIAFEEYVKNKTQNHDFKIVYDNGTGCPIFLAFQYLYKFVHTVDLKDIKDELDRLQNEVYEVNKMITEYIDESLTKDER
jgi:hypothetical protein